MSQQRGRSVGRSWNPPINPQQLAPPSPVPASSSLFNRFFGSNPSSASQNNVSPVGLRKSSRLSIQTTPRNIESNILSPTAQANIKAKKDAEDAADADRLKAAEIAVAAKALQRKVIAETGPIKSGDTIPLASENICSWRTVDLANNIFGPTFLADNFTRRNSEGEDISRNVRSLWDFEKSRVAEKQCIGAISDEPKNLCWLCGLETNPQDIDLIESCDHVLPIAQAVMFLGLFRYPDVLDKFVDEIKAYNPETQDRIGPAIAKFNENLTHTPQTVIKMEYAWSHKCCNLVKNNSVFIKIQDPNESIIQWEVNELNIKNTLNNLLTDPRCLKLRNLKGYPRSLDQQKEWSNTSRDNIVKHKIQNILIHLNSKPAGLQAFVMTSMSKCLASVHPLYSSKITKQELQTNEIVVKAKTISIFGDFASTLIPSFILSPIRAIATCVGRTCRRGKGRNKKRNHKTKRVRKH